MHRLEFKLWIKSGLIMNTLNRKIYYAYTYVQYSFNMFLVVPALYLKGYMSGIRMIYYLVRFSTNCKLFTFFETPISFTL